MSAHKQKQRWSAFLLPLCCVAALAWSAACWAQTAPAPPPASDSTTQQAPAPPPQADESAPQSHHMPHTSVRSRNLFPDREAGRPGERGLSDRGPGFGGPGFSEQRDMMFRYMPLPAAQHSYKLVLALHTQEAGKPVTQMYTVVLNGNGAPCDLDLRSRVPITIGNRPEDHFNFEGVGLHIETHVREKSTGVELTFSMDQDSIVRLPNAERPVIRHTHFGTAAIMPEGKTITLGNFEDPSGNGLAQVDATLSILQ